MDLQNQVCSLESAKKLKELGVKQESLFYWQHLTDFSISKGMDFKPELNYKKQGYAGASIWEETSAFTVAELGEMLPKDYCLSGKTEYGEPFRAFWCGLENISWFWDETEAEARALMLICLLENKLITAEEINKEAK
jgi:hypothetical protein